MMTKESLCNICKCKLDQLGDPTSLDCGGDCALCMAEAGDTDCLIRVEEFGMRLLRILKLGCKL